ncbi:MAG: dynamin family protein [Proteobacteria bacterium]|nr:dynamin family protein [Pseudomonadota bacterium]
MPRLDALAQWRAQLAGELTQLQQHLGEAGLLMRDQQLACEALQGRLANDPLVLVCVAEFSAGKSELLNALLFPDAGCRLLPAAPGATTMCPVELGWDARLPAQLALLPIETHGEPLTLAQWRERPEAWHGLPLEVDQPRAMADALQAVTQTRQVTREQARAWGLTPAAGAGRDRVAVPAWRHALLNMPHPLLASGLVVVDTPGLGAIGVEPGLTLGLLPAAAAVFFVIDASRGVSRGDLDLWQTHLADPALSRFVVLSKLDLLADPLSTPAEQAMLIQDQCTQVARTLGVPQSQVFAVSAREALTAGLGDSGAVRQERLTASGVLPLKSAIIEQLLPQRQQLLTLAVASFTQSLQGQLTRHVRELRRSHAQQMLELRALEAKTGSRADQIGQRLAREEAEFAVHSERVQALQADHTQQLTQVLAPLSDALWREVDGQLAAILAGPWYLPRSATAFAQLFDGLQQRVDDLEAALQAMAEDLARQLADIETGDPMPYVPTQPPDLARLRSDLAQIQGGYARYFGVRQMARMTVPQFVEQFRRMLTSRMRSVFEHAIHQIKLWSRATLEPLEEPLAQRETYLARRRETLARAQSARAELLHSLTELVRQDELLLAQAEQGQRLATALRAAAQQSPDRAEPAASELQDAAA